MNPQIDWLDALKEIDQTLWSGRISLNRSSLKNLDESKIHISKSYSPTKSGAAIRCIDGRPAIVKVGSLGPQTAGGSPGIALTVLVVNDKKHHVLDSLSELVQNRLLDFEHGAHIDTFADGPHCGCGAIDKMAEIITKIKDNSQKIKSIVKLVMENEFNQAAYTTAIKSFKDLNTSELLPEDYRHELIRLTNHHEHAIEKVIGLHNEVAVVVNKVTDTTLDKDPLSHSTGHEVQAFGFDYWFAQQYAGNNKELLTALVIYQVAAALVLTDGTLAIGIRQLAMLN